MGGRHFGGQRGVSSQFSEGGKQIFIFNKICAGVELGKQLGRPEALGGQESCCLCVFGS